MREGRYDLAALDMDGTLLNSAHRITPFTRDALTRADAAGKVVALCTGRCLSELRAHLRELPGVRYAINESGGCLYDVVNDKVLHQSAIDREVGEWLFDLAAPRDVLIQCFFGGQSYLQPDASDRLDHWHVGDFTEAFVAGSVFTRDIRALWRASGLPMEKFNVYFASEDEKARFSEGLGAPALYITACMGIGYEISPRDASKARGLELLCRHLGIPVSRTMAVGDGGNDVDLMRSAGFAVAMGNAVGEVLGLADAVTDDCDHDGAAKAVLRYMLGEDEQY